MTDRKKMRELLKKAKLSIDSQNAKLKAKDQEIGDIQERFRDATLRNQDLMATLEIFQQKRNGIKRDQVKQILARFKINELSFTLFETKDLEFEWYKDT